MSLFWRVFFIAVLDAHCLQSVFWGGHLTLAAMRATLRLLLATTLLWLVACSERQENSYASFAEAQSSGAITRGWVPTWLPPTTTAITELHDIDTKRFMVRFAFPQKSAVPLPAGCVRVSPFAPPAPPFLSTWWPADVPASHLSTHRHSFFQCGTTFAAVSENLGEGYVWQP